MSTFNFSASGKLQEIWTILDEIDQSLWVVNLKQPSCAGACCQTNFGSDCFIMLSIHVNGPRCLPECCFMGSGPMLNCFKKPWQRNSKRWNHDKPFLENVAILLEIQLPITANHHNSCCQVECGICHAQFLPSDEELGIKSGSGTYYTCDNSSCSKAFHSVCHGNWLHSIAKTGPSYDFLFRNCPYCSETIAHFQ